MTRTLQVQHVIKHLLHLLETDFQRVHLECLRLDRLLFQRPRGLQTVEGEHCDDNQHLAPAQYNAARKGKTRYALAVFNGTRTSWKMYAAKSERLSLS